MGLAYVSKSRQKQLIAAHAKHLFLIVHCQIQPAEKKQFTANRTVLALFFSQFPGPLSLFRSLEIGHLPSGSSRSFWKPPSYNTSAVLPRPFVSFGKLLSCDWIESSSDYKRFRRWCIVILVDIHFRRCRFFFPLLVLFFRLKRYVFRCSFRNPLVDYVFPFIEFSFIGIVEFSFRCLDDSFRRNWISTFFRLLCFPG